MRVYVKWANFTPKPRFEIVKLRIVALKKSRGSQFEKNIHGQRVQMQRISFERGLVLKFARMT